MKTPKEWATEIRKGAGAAGGWLRYDPVLTDGRSLLEALVNDIQLETLIFAKANTPEEVDKAMQDRIKDPN